MNTSSFGGFLKRGSAPPQRPIGFGDRAEDERSLQDERLARSRRIPTDDLGYPLEPVAHGVGVHEQFARGGLEGPAVVEVAPERREQFGGVSLQRPIDAVDEGGSRERVAGEG